MQNTRVQGRFQVVFEALENRLLLSTGVTDPLVLGEEAAAALGVVTQPLTFSVSNAPIWTGGIGFDKAATLWDFNAGPWTLAGYGITSMGSSFGARVYANTGTVSSTFSGTLELNLPDSVQPGQQDVPVSIQFVPKSGGSMSGVFGAGLDIPLQFDMAWQLPWPLPDGSFDFTVNLEDYAGLLGIPIPKDILLNTSGSFTPNLGTQISVSKAADVADVGFDLLSLAALIPPPVGTVAAAVSLIFDLNLGMDIELERTDYFRPNSLSGNVYVNGTNNGSFSLSSSSSKTVYVDIPNTSASSISIDVGNLFLSNTFHTDFSLLSGPFFEAQIDIPLIGSWTPYRNEWPNAEFSLISLPSKQLNFSITNPPPVTVPVVWPEVAVSGNGRNISDGDTSPSTSDGTDFGNGPVSRTFRVRNSGTAPLTTSGLSVPSGFTVTNGLSSSIPTGAYDEFTVKFTGSTESSGDIRFRNNDADGGDGIEDPFNFRIVGGPPTEPEVAVSGNGRNISDGDTSPSTSDGTDFGTGLVSRTFRVTNSGNAPLTTSGLSVPSGFTVTNGLSSSISAGGYDDFTVKFTGSTESAGDISFRNNDADGGDGVEDPFNFRIIGRADQDADLALQSLTVSRPSDRAARTFTACGFDIKNNGPVSVSSESVVVDYYLSKNTAFGDGDDKKIGDTGFTLSIASGATSHINLSSTGLGNMVRFWTSSLVSQENYYVFAKVRLGNPPPTDPISSNDYDRTDSPFAYIPDILLPDLVGTVVSASPEPGEWGAGLNITASVSNQGNALAGASTAKFYMSSDDTITDGDFYLGSAPVGALSTDGSESISVSYTYEWPPPNGFTDYDDVWIGMIVDADNEVPESNEDNNNTATDHVPMVPPPRPDLTVAVDSYLAGAYSNGDSFQATGTETNSSAVGIPSTDTFWIEAHISGDRQWGNGDDYVVGRWIEDEGMDPWESYQTTETLTIPPGADDGNYYLAVKIDSDSEIAESNDENNVWWSTAADIEIASNVEHQVITGEDQKALAGGDVSIPISYDVSDGDSTLAGLGLRIHYDSSKLTWTGLADVLGTDKLFESGAPESDPSAGGGYDGDPATDKFVRVIWQDTAPPLGEWPNAPLPTQVATAEFTVAPGVPKDTTTDVRFSAQETDPDYDFHSTPATVEVIAFTWDIDGNNQVRAMSDGSLLLWYLWQLPDIAFPTIGSGATRTTPQDVKSYLDEAGAILDIDGNGQEKAMSDGSLFIWHAWDLPDASMPNVGSGATRTTPQQIREYIDRYWPSSPMTLEVTGAESGQVGADLAISADLDQIADAAIGLWQAAGASAVTLETMRNATISVMDLPGSVLGEATDRTIRLDIDAAGTGWFVDPTPQQSTEFTQGGTKLRADLDGAADGLVDLVTVMSHEMGHLARLTHADAGDKAGHVMNAVLSAGVRRLPVALDALDVLASIDAVEQLGSRL